MILLKKRVENVLIRIHDFLDSPTIMQFVRQSLPVPFIRFSVSAAVDIYEKGYVNMICSCLQETDIMRITTTSWAVIVGLNMLIRLVHFLWNNFYLTS